MPDASVVTAAWVGGIVSGAVALVGLGVSTVVTIVNSRSQRKLDEKLARERAEAELRLAERRFVLDRALKHWERRTTLAEEVLADFYLFRFVIQDSRSPFVAAEEMTPQEGVPDEIAENANYAPMRRLRERDHFFSDLHAKRNRFAAIFGGESATYFDDALRVRQQIFVRVQQLLRWPDWAAQNRDEYERAYRVVFNTGEDDDPITPQVDRIVGNIEALCRPAIEAGANPE